jgi:hypothetical protein
MLMPQMHIQLGDETAAAGLFRIEKKTARLVLSSHLLNSHLEFVFSLIAIFAADGNQEPLGSSQPLR